MNHSWKNTVFLRVLATPARQVGMQTCTMATTMLFLGTRFQLKVLFFFFFIRGLVRKIFSFGYCSILFVFNNYYLIMD